MTNDLKQERKISMKVHRPCVGLPLPRGTHYIGTKRTRKMQHRSNKKSKNTQELADVEMVDARNED